MRSIINSIIQSLTSSVVPVVSQQVAPLGKHVLRHTTKQVVINTSRQYTNNVIRHAAFLNAQQEVNEAIRVFNSTVSKNLFANVTKSSIDRIFNK
jgi:hypothetical protein